MVTLNTYGQSIWANISDTWRAEDINWLQDRLVLRQSTLPTASPSTEGVVAYDSTSKKVVYSNGSSSWLSFLSSTNMSVTDSGTNPNKKTVLSAGVAGGLALKQDGTVQVESALDVTGVLVVATTGTPSVKIKAVGAATATLNTNATSLVSDIGISAPSLIATSSGTGGGVTTTKLAVSAAATFTGGLTSNSLTSTSMLLSGGTFNAGSGTLSNVGTLQVAGTITMSGTGTISRGNASLAFNGTDVTLGNTTGQTIISGVNPPQVKTGSYSAVQIAGIIISTTTPPVGNYPDGTIWFQV